MTSVSPAHCTALVTEAVWCSGKSLATGARLPRFQFQLYQPGLQADDLTLLHFPIFTVGLFNTYNLGEHIKVLKGVPGA